MGMKGKKNIYILAEKRSNTEWGDNMCNGINVEMKQKEER